MRFRFVVLVPAIMPILGCNALSPATPQQLASYQGIYSGQAVSFDPAMPGAGCQARIPMTGFHVIGNQVEIGGFKATVREDGSVELFSPYGKIFGHFEKVNQFAGELIGATDGCRYRILLSRNG